MKGPDHMFHKALFLFRRDLRLQDNTGLILALEQAKKVLPCFIFTPEQIEHNAYANTRCLQFMIECLEDLECELKKKGAVLHLFYGHPEEVVSSLIEKSGVDAVFVNQDYTPYSIQRDLKIKNTCAKHNVPFFSSEDLLLHPLSETVKADGKPYTVFTPFYKNALRLSIRKPCKNPYTNYDNSSPFFAKDNSLYNKILPHRAIQAKGGRTEGLKVLRKVSNLTSYETLRDFPYEDATTHLSAHLKFTTYSVREIYEYIAHHVPNPSEILRSLYWRDFFTSIAFHFPHVFMKSFHAKFDHLHWEKNHKLFKAWCEGKTGFPLVDAGMRELNQTGFMPNRVRMIAASVLIKDFHIHWQLGEKYFAQKLIDYDPCVNNGNWQWVAGTGCDAAPYFRIFNPWTQTKKFDPEAAYIKKWVEELSSIPSDTILHWDLEKKRSDTNSYPAPLVDHAKESKVTLSYYKKSVM